MDEYGHEGIPPGSQDLLAHVPPPVKTLNGDAHELRLPHHHPLQSFPQRNTEEGHTCQQPACSTEIPEELLVAQAEQGDKNAFDLLVRRYEAEIHRYIRRMVGNAEEAADLTQETFLKAWRYLPGHDPKRKMNLRPWLYKVASSVTTDKWRSQSQQNATASLEELREMHVPEQASGKQDIATDLCTKESIAAALNAMYPKYRRCLELKYFMKYTDQEIAYELNIEPGTVRTNLSRGRQQFINAYTRDRSNKTERNDTASKGGR